jgi:hypothetical protein
MRKQLIWWLISITIISGIRFYVLIEYSHMKHAPVEKLSGFTGKTISELESTLGLPDSEILIPINDIRDEFRCEILNRYPPTSPANKGVKIKEVTWKRPDYTITAWFHQDGNKWLCVEAVRWQNNVVF